MDKGFIETYQSELKHLRDGTVHFARQHPGAAAQFRIDAQGCGDPFVERLLEGFAFLAAGVRRKMDAEFPAFTQELLETVYPDFLAPVPSMAVVEFDADGGSGKTVVPRLKTELRGPQPAGGTTRCLFRTCHDVELWPIRLDERPQGMVRYFERDLHALELPAELKPKSALRLRLRLRGTVKKFSELKGFDELPVFIAGTDQAAKLYEHLFGEVCVGNERMLNDLKEQKLPFRVGKENKVYVPSASHVIMRGASDPEGTRAVIYALGGEGAGAPVLRPLGFDSEHAILPCSRRTFDGYRLLREYVTMPERLHFFKISGLAAAAARCEEEALDIIILFQQADATLAAQVDNETLKLFCTPVVNLFSQKAQPLILSDKHPEPRVVIDSRNPADYEIHSVTAVRAIPGAAGPGGDFLPFYKGRSGTGGALGYFSARRCSSLPPREEKKRREAISQQQDQDKDYEVRDVRLSFTTTSGEAVRPQTNLTVETLCTNGALPERVFDGRKRDLEEHQDNAGESGATDFTVEIGIQACVRLVVQPTKPRPSPRDDATAWGLINHLSLNYLTLSGAESGAKALREMFALYDPVKKSGDHHWSDAIESIESAPVVRRVQAVDFDNTTRAGPVAFARGTEISLQCSDMKLGTRSLFMLGAVLSRFFARYASINSFTELTLGTKSTHIMTWRSQPGKRTTL